MCNILVQVMLTHGLRLEDLNQRGNLIKNEVLPGILFYSFCLIKKNEKIKKKRCYLPACLPTPVPSEAGQAVFSGRRTECKSFKRMERKSREIQFWSKSCLHSRPGWKTWTSRDCYPFKNKLKPTHLFAIFGLILIMQLVLLQFYKYWFNSAIDLFISNSASSNLLILP